MVVVPRLYEVRKKSLAGVSRAKKVCTNPIYMLFHSTPQEATQVQPLNVPDNREVMKSPSGLLDRNESQLGEDGESTPENGGLASVQIPSLIPFSPVVQGEFLENQIREIDHGLSCFDTNDGVVSIRVGHATVVVPFGHDMRSDLAPTTTPVPNPSIVVFGDVSDSGSLSVSGKVVPTRQKRIVRMASDSVISTDSGGVQRAVSRKENCCDLSMAGTGVELRQEP